MIIADMKTYDQIKFWECVLSLESEILSPLLLSKNIKISKEEIFCVRDWNFASHVTGGYEVDNAPARTAEEDIWA
jgi:hypothetical protein